MKAGKSPPADIHVDRFDELKRMYGPARIGTAMLRQQRPRPRSIHSISCARASPAIGGSPLAKRTVEATGGGPLVIGEHRANAAAWPAFIRHRRAALDEPIISRRRQSGAIADGASAVISSAINAMNRQCRAVKPAIENRRRVAAEMPAKPAMRRPNAHPVEAS